MCRCRSGKDLAFSLLEVVIVVAIIAILAGVAIPRLSRGAKGAADATLAGSLRTLRSAIDHYAAEHGGSFPNATDCATQLTKYTNGIGETKPKKDTTHIYGPYLRDIPSLPVGAKKGKAGIRQADEANAGWIYDPATGMIRANCLDKEVDDTGKKYKDY